MFFEAESWRCGLYDVINNVRLLAKMLSKVSNQGASNPLLSLENRRVTRSISQELRSAIANGAFNFYGGQNGGVGNVGDDYLAGHMDADLYTENVLEEANSADVMNMLVANNTLQNGGASSNRMNNEKLLQSWLANSEVWITSIRYISTHHT